MTITTTVTAPWLEAREATWRRDFGRGLAVSCALHFLVGLLLVISPEPKPMRSPEAILVRMITLPQLIRATAKQTAPEPVPARPRPKPVPKQVILPKQPAAATKKPKRKPKPKPLDYDDALAALREELGEEAPVLNAPLVQQQAAQANVVEPGPSAHEVDPEILAWNVAVERHVRKGWTNPPEFKNQALRTGLRFRLSAAGDILGAPEVIRSSGNPFYDDNTMRALIRASPLPPPPQPGDWTFVLSADEGR